MAWRKGPYSDEIYEEWDQLVLDKGAKLSLQEREKRWRILYERFFVDGRWIVSSDDMGLIATLGRSIALEGQDWELANRLAQEVLIHEHLDVRKDRLVIMDAFIWEGVTEILLGKIESGVSKLSAPFHEGGTKLWEYRLFLRLPLGGALDAIGLDKAADRRVANLVAELIASFPNCKRLSRKVSGAVTNGDLNDLLDQTYPARKKKDLSD